jgi:hypothetical protein
MLEISHQKYVQQLYGCQAVYLIMKDFFSDWLMRFPKLSDECMHPIGFLVLHRTPHMNPLNNSYGAH